jgi:nucleoid-associated protein YgaU
MSMQEGRMSRFVTLAIAVGLSLCLLGCPSAPPPVQNTVAAPTFKPAAGTFTDPVTVEIACQTEGAEIHYTLDGSEPTSTTGTVYATPIKIDKTATITAIAVKKDWQDSPVMKGTFEIKPVPVAVVPPITDEEVLQVRNAIARAKEADATYYDPDDLTAAEQLLDDALEARDKDPAKARQLLASAKEKADLAFQTSVEKEAASLAERMAALKQTLLDKEADKYLPTEYEAATAGIDEAGRLYANGEIAQAREKAYDTLKAMADLSSLLDERIAWVKILKRDTEQYLQDAEAADAGQWAPEAKNKANALYLQGMDAFQSYRLDDAEESFGQAREAAKDALRLARENKSATVAEQKKKAEELRAQAMKALEEASGLTIVTEDGTVIKPKQMTEDDFLKQIQLMEEQRKKQQLENQSMAIPQDSTTVVLEGESGEDLLTQAKELWTLGLEEEGKGNYVQAQEYYAEALRYIEIYKSYAVKGVYTVRLIPERRDCLWRISEYDFIYGNPQLWPKIWRRNRKLIQNPDLIYPGWLLVIPPD